MTPVAQMKHTSRGSFQTFGTKNMKNTSNLYNRLNSGSFVFPYRIGRLEYFLRGLGLGVLMAFPSILSESIENVILQLVFSILTLSIVIASFWIYIIPRMRDLGWNPKLAWLMIVPGVNIVMGIGLLFMPPK